LAKAWEINNPAQQQARDFVYGEWSKPQDTAGLKALLPRAREALDTLRKAGDWLSVRKLALGNLTHTAGLAKRLQVIQRQRESEDLRNETRNLRQLTDELSQLHREAVAFVRQGKEQTP